jgi:uncharacterized membrane-anchored protein
MLWIANLIAGIICGIAVLINCYTFNNYRLMGSKKGMFNITLLIIFMIFLTWWNFHLMMINLHPSPVNTIHHI